MAGNEPPDAQVPEVTIEAVTAALKTALSATTPSRKIPFPDDNAVQELWYSCLIAQSNVRSNPDRAALYEGQRRLAAHLAGASDELYKMALLRLKLSRKSALDGVDLNLNDVNPPSRFIEVQVNIFAFITETFASLETIRNRPEMKAVVARTDLYGRHRTWSDIAPELADASLKAIQTVSPEAGRYKLPPYFVAAILPHITADVVTPGAVRTEILDALKRGSPKRRLSRKSKNPVKTI